LIERILERLNGGGMAQQQQQQQQHIRMTYSSLEKKSFTARLPQPAAFGAIDLDDNAVLHHDVHRPEPQVPQRLANLEQFLLPVRRRQFTLGRIQFSGRHGTIP
jgi:hypothetical protein